MKNFRSILMVIVACHCTIMYSQQVPNKLNWEQFKDENQGRAIENIDPLLCPPWSIWSQPVTDPDGPWVAYNSDYAQGFTTYENFSGLTAVIKTIHFWGLNLAFDDQGLPIVCDNEDPMTFNIRFLYDNGGLPGASYADIYTAAYRVNTGGYYGIFPLYQYTIQLGLPIELTDGWIYIRGYSTSDPNCIFFWANSQTGDYYGFQEDADGNMVQIENNLSLCFETINTVIPISGWAIAIGIFLITGIMILRYRRIV